MSNTIPLFPFKIYKTHYDKHEWIKENLFSKLDTAFDAAVHNNQHFQRDGNVCTYHVEADINRRYPEETKDLVAFTEAAARDYWKELDYFPGLDPFILEIWANKSPRGGYIASHLHLSLPFTAVYYVDASPEQGNLVFENPSDLLLSAQPVNYLAGKYQFEHEVEVNSGDLLIFPGYMKHRSIPNRTDRPRLILGITFGARGFYWQKNWVAEEKGDIDQIIAQRANQPPTY
jgi:uncharacterized protein (TIGR02466 family)